MTMVELWIVLSRVGDPLIALMLAILGASSAMIGPGAWNVNARLFGRKHIAPQKHEARSDNPKGWVSGLPESMSSNAYHRTSHRTDHLGLFARRRLLHTSMRGATEFH